LWDELGLNRNGMSSVLEALDALISMRYEMLANDAKDKLLDVVKKLPETCKEKNQSKLIKYALIRDAAHYFSRLTLLLVRVGSPQLALVI